MGGDMECNTKNGRRYGMCTLHTHDPHRKRVVVVVVVVVMFIGAW